MPVSHGRDWAVKSGRAEEPFRALREQHPKPIDGGDICRAGHDGRRGGYEGSQQARVTRATGRRLWGQRLALECRLAILTLSIRHQASAGELLVGFGGGSIRSRGRGGKSTWSSLERKKKASIRGDGDSNAQTTWTVQLPFVNPAMPSTAMAVGPARYQ